ncbi:MAG: hypothetical protein AAF402_01650 [Pseudomonadota bacterium]
MKNENRRKALLRPSGVARALIASKETLPTHWSTPIVDSVLLPAHARSTPTTDSSPSTGFEPFINS